MASRELRVEIVGDARSLQRALGQAGKSSDGLSKSMGVLKGAALGVAGVAAGALVVGLKRGWEEMEEAQKVSAQTEAVLKSTGAQAGVTAKDVEDLASSLSKISGVDDEVIQSGENLLLTFTNIRNEVGKGNNIFDRATTSILDMSVALGQDMKSSAIQVGKALNDPIKGITALRRVGVSFTASQIEMIKKLTESGKTLDAQKLILRELNKEFGGSAKAAGETLPGQINKMKNAFDEASAKLIEKLLPYLTRFVNFLVENGPAMAEALRPIADGIGMVARIIEPLLPTILLFGKYLMDNMLAPLKIIAALLKGDWSAAWDAAKAPFVDILDILQPVTDFIKTAVPEAFNAAISGITSAATGALTAAKNFGAQLLSGVTSGIVGIASKVLDKFHDIISGIGNLVTGAYNAALSFGGKVLSGVTAGVVGLITAVVGKFTDIISGIGDKFEAAFTKASDFGGRILNGLKNGLVTIVGWMAGKIGDVLSAIGDKAGAAFDKGSELGGKIINGLKSGAVAVWETVSTWFSDLPGKIVTAIGDLSKTLFSAGQAVLQGFLDGLVDKWNAIKDFISGIAGWISGHKGPESEDEKLLEPHGRAIMGGLQRGLEDGWQPIASFIETTAEIVGSAFDDTSQGVRSLGMDFDRSFDKIAKKVEDVVPEVVTGLRPLTDALSELVQVIMRLAAWADEAFGRLKKLGTVEGGGGGGSIGIHGPSLSDLQGFATGGTVPGRLGAPRLVIAHGGETITPPGRGGGGANVYNFHFPNYVGDKRDLQQAMQEAAADWSRRNGSDILG